MKIIEKVIVIDKINEHEVPYFVWHLFGDQCKNIFLNGSEQISMGEDYESVDNIRKALDWYVDEFGGKIKWGKK